MADTRHSNATDRIQFATCASDDSFASREKELPLLRVKPLRKSRSFRAGEQRSSVWLSVFTATIAWLATFGCGTPHAVLNFTAPSTVVAGSPFSVTVTATINGQRDTVVNSYISFTSSDPSAVLPSYYRFTAADAGSHTWTNGFTLKATGDQTISASMYDAAGINGTVTVSVSPP